MTAVLARASRVFAILAVVWLWAAPAALADPTFPALSGRIVDEAHLITSPDVRASLDAKLASLEADTGDQFVIVTLNGLQDYEIEDYGYRLGRAWGIGDDETDRGVLLIVAPNERKVRIEVGYGLEPVMTDALSSHIIQSEILPAFKTGAYELGITRGADAVIAQLRLDPETARQQAAEAEPESAGFPIGVVIFVVIILFFLVLAAARGARGGKRRRGGVSPILVWAASEALRNASRSSGGGGGFSSGGGGFGGGGFSGGGGSFGGGGASGGW